MKPYKKKRYAITFTNEYAKKFGVENPRISNMARKVYRTTYEGVPVVALDEGSEVFYFDRKYVVKFERLPDEF